MKTLLIVMAALLAVLAGACDPYHPDLGDTPFRCQPPDPMRPNLQRCPDGYMPVDVAPPTTCLCEKGTASQPDANMDQADSGMFSCNADPNEPNEDINTATPTTVGTGTMNMVFQNLAICSSPTLDDHDVFKLSAASSGKAIVARINYNEPDGELVVEILNSGATSVAQGVKQTNQATAMYTTPAGGDYYVRVKPMSSGGKNNYNLQIQVN